MLEKRESDINLNVPRSSAARELTGGVLFRREILFLLTKSSVSNCGHEAGEFSGLNRLG